jgi:uncharacterized small protein (DUF1192 family)
MLFVVTAIDRSSLGLKGSWRGGRFWPSSASTTVEVQDADQCPMIDDPIKPGKKILDPLRIGRLAWTRIKNDPTLSKNPAPEGAKLESIAKKTAQQIEAENDDLRQLVADLNQRLAALEKELLGAPVSAPLAAKPSSAGAPAPAVDVLAVEAEAPTVDAPTAEAPKAKPKDKTWGRNR